MIEVEQSEKNLQADELSLAQKQADFIQQNSKLLGEQTHLKTQKDRFQSERNIPLSAISSENLAVYQKLRIQKRGIAIVRVEDGACTACEPPYDLKKSNLQNRLPRLFFVHAAESFTLADRLCFRFRISSGYHFILAGGNRCHCFMVSF